MNVGIFELIDFKGRDGERDGWRYDELKKHLPKLKNYIYALGPGFEPSCGG